MTSHDLIPLVAPSAQETTEARAVGEAVLAATSDAVVAFDARGKVGFLNPAAKVLLGRASNRALGADFGALLIPSSREAVRRAVERFVSQGPPYLGPGRVEVLVGEIGHPVEITPVRFRSKGQWCGALVLRDDAEREVFARLLEHEATHDRLTGLPNRGYLGDLVRQSLARATRDGTTVGLIFVGLDGFRDLNTARGHDVGDAVLAETARRLRRLVPACDAVVRAGGDEFAVVLETSGGADALWHLAQEAQVTLERPFKVAGGGLRLTAGIGIASASDISASAAELIHQADVALLRAKELGAGSLHTFEQSTKEGVCARHALEVAVKEEGFASRLNLVYQPLVGAATGEWAGAEALLRWQDASGRSIHPEALVATLERTGLIASVGAWALETACKEAVRWHGVRGQEELHIAVNLSVRQLELPDIVEVVQSILTQTGLAARFLTLEVTESALAIDVGSMIRRLEALRALGITVAIDDFGTGYSSLAYLHRLPADVLKIDRSFVSRLDGPEPDTAIVEAICSLAQTIGLRVVAEGVETQAQLELLEAMGVDYLQGYYFSRPVASDQLDVLLENKPAV